MPVACTETGLPRKVPGETEHPALPVSLHDVLEEGLGHVLRPEGVSGKKARLGVLAGLCTNVNRHGGIVPGHGAPGQAPSAVPRPRLLRRGSGRARLPRGRGPARARPFRRPARERAPDRASAPGRQPRSLGARLRQSSPSWSRAASRAWSSGRSGRSRSCGTSSATASPSPWTIGPGSRSMCSKSRRRAGASGLRAATLHDLDVLVGAAAEAYREEVGVDAYARDPALFEWRTRSQIDEGRSWLWKEDGRILFKAEASAWTPEAVQLQQVWVEPELRGHGLREARPGRPLPPPARDDADGLPLRPPRERAGDRALRRARHAPHHHLQVADLRLTPPLDGECASGARPFKDSGERMLRAYGLANFARGRPGGRATGAAARRLRRRGAPVEGRRLPMWTLPRSARGSKSTSAGTI